MRTVGPKADHLNRYAEDWTKGDGDIIVETLHNPILVSAEKPIHQLGEVQSSADAETYAERCHAYK